MTPVSINKVRLQIFADHCAAAAESMAYTLCRAAHSTFVKETEDFTTGLTTPQGQTYASPHDLGATWFVCLDYKNVIERVANYEEGDIYMTSDPYSGFVCTHAPDLHLWKPVFHDGEIISFAVGHVHNTDVGGAVPASLSRTLTEVHQEGVRIPPVKLSSRTGGINQDLLDLVFTNVRVPEQNWGDLKAQIAALNTGERKVHAMVAKFGIETFKAGIAGVLDYSESQARAVVRDMTDGRYFFADYIDEDSAGGRPCRIALTLTVAGDGLDLDFSGSDPQLQSSLNLPSGGNARHALIMVGLTYVLYALDPGLLLNSGLARCVTGTLPEGTVVNPTYPAAVGMRSLMCKRIQGLIMGVFAQVMPHRMAADPSSGGPMVNVNTVDGRTGRRLVACIDPMPGGAGGSPAGDGAEGSGANEGFLKNTPVEISEVEVPVKIRRYGLLPNSGGAGRFRGGLGAVLEFEVFTPGTRITARNRDRTRFTAWGLQGGLPAAPCAFALNKGSNREIDLGNTDFITVDPGDVVYVASGGGGGFGPASERPADLVLTDVRRGFVSLASAAADYGVVIVDDAVDMAATAERRAGLAIPAGTYTFGAGRDAFEAVWTPRNYERLTAILAALPVHWRFFVKHRIFEILDANGGGGEGEAVDAAFAEVARQNVGLRHEIERAAA